MRILIAFARAYPKRGAAVVVALFLAGIAEGLGLSVFLPLVKVATSPAGDPTAGLGLISDVLARVGLRPTIGVLLVLIIGALCVKSVLLLEANRHVGYAVADVATDLRLRLLRALLRARWEYFVRQPIGALSNAVSNEVNRASEAYLNAAMLVSLSIEVAVYLGVALVVSWQGALAAVGVGSLLMYGLSTLVRKARRAGNRQTKLQKSLLTRLADTLQAVKALKAMAREEAADKFLVADTTKLGKAFRKKVLTRESLRAVQEGSLAIFIGLGIYAAISVYGMGFARVMVLVVLFSRLLGYLGKIQRQYQQLVTFESAYWAVLDTIGEAEGAQEAVSGRTEPPPVIQGIRFDNVSFSYGSNVIVRGADFFLPAKALTALVGPSGAGKTTLVDIAVGLLQPAEGQVLVDGVPLSALDARAWRQSIGYVPQETILLHDTIAQNVSLGDPQVKDSDVLWALGAAGAMDFVTAMPEGVRTVVGERGGRLSGGQRQRIAIARAIVGRPKLLILDEATTALDPETEAAICQTLISLRGTLTILSISHQPALVGVADRVYRLEAGRVSLLRQGRGEDAGADPALSRG